MQKRYDATILLLFFCGVGFWKARDALINKATTAYKCYSFIHLTLIVKPVYKQEFCDW